MAPRPGNLRRTADRDVGEDSQWLLGVDGSGTEARSGVEPASASLPDTQEWQVNCGDETTRDAEQPAGAPVPPAAERIRVTTADAAVVVEQRSIDETLAVEEELAPTGGPVSLSGATFEDLRGLGLSVTQAKRVLDFRERLGGFDSVDDLDYVPGFPRSVLAELKEQVTL